MHRWQGRLACIPTVALVSFWEKEKERALRSFDTPTKIGSNHRNWRNESDKSGDGNVALWYLR